MAVTQNTYTGDGTTVLFSFAFPYLEATDIKVSVNGTITTAYTLANATTVQFNTAPANGAAIRIYRQTDDSDLSATFYPGSAIRSQDLNDNFTQNLYVTQEVNNNAVKTDGSNTMVGNLDMGGFEVINSGAPSSDGSLVNKQYVDSRFGAVDIPSHTRWTYNAVGGETSLSGVGSDGATLQYSPTREQVFLNGALLQRGVDYTADNGTTITLLSGALIAGDLVDVRCVNNLPTADTAYAENVNYRNQFAGQVQRTVASKLSDVVSVKDFGAVGDGVTDDTAAIQAALDSLSTTGGTVLLPAGKYKVTSTLTIPAYVTLEGAARADGASTQYATRIQCAHAGRCIQLDGNRASIRNLTIKYTVTASTSEAIYAYNVADPIISNIYIVDAFNGVQLVSCNAPVVEYCDIANCLGSYGFKVEGEAANYADSFLLTNVSSGFTSSGPAGFQHVYLGNYTNSGKIRGYRFVKGDYGIVLDGTTDDPDDIWIEGGGCDNQVINAYRFNSGQNIFLNDAWAGQAGKDGIVLGTNFTGNASLVSPRVRGSGFHGLKIAGGNVIHIVNPLIGQNSTDTANTYSGISVSAAVSKLSVVGGTCGTLEAGGANDQKDGIELANASIDNVYIGGVNLNGNVTRAFTTAASTKNIFIENCPGYDQIDGYITLTLNGTVTNGSYNLAVIGSKKILIKSVARVLSAGTCSVRMFDNGGSGMTTSVSTTTTASITNLSTPVTIDATGGVRHLTVTVSSASSASDLVVTFGYQKLPING